MGFCRKELLYVLILACGSTFVGQSLGYFSPAGPPMREEFGWSESLASVFSALSSVVAIVGGPLTNVIVPKLGRKKPAFIYAAAATVTWILLVIVRKSFAWLAFVVRALQGVCVGGLSSLCSMYIVEISPEEQRGAYGTIHQLGVTIGMAYCYFLGIFCSWRLTTGLCALFSFLLAVLVWFVPESPAVARQESQGANDKLCQRKYVRPLIDSVLFMFFQQFSGINALDTNLEAIFKAANVDLKPSICALLVGLSQCISTAATSWTVERFGRKAAFNVSAIGQFVALILTWAQDVWHLTSILSIVALFLDFFFFGVGFGPVPWFIVPELFPDSVRQLATSLMTGLNWAFVSIIIFMWPPMRDGIGSGWGLFVFAIICLIGFFWGIFLMPETKGQGMGGAAEEASQKSDDTSHKSDGDPVPEEI